MVYKMTSPKGKYILYTIQPECLILTTIASVCGLWANVVDFPQFDEAI